MYNLENDIISKAKFGYIGVENKSFGTVGMENNLKKFEYFI